MSAKSCPFYHDSFIPPDLRANGWSSWIDIDSPLHLWYISKTFICENFEHVEKLVTIIDELEINLDHHATVVVDKEYNEVEVRLTTKYYQVPTLYDTIFARQLTIRHINLTLRGPTKPYLFIDFDGTVRCVVSTGMKHKPYRAPIECHEVEVFPQCIEILKNAKEEGYVIVGVTNQSGITKRGIPEEKILACVEETKRQLQLDFPVYYASDRGPLYKPAIGMGIEAIKENGAIDFENSVMVGDNHKNGDRGFANGMGIEFRYAQDFFHLSLEQLSQCGYGDAFRIKSPTIESVGAEAEPPLHGKTIEAPYEVKVYVPSTRLDEVISEKEYSDRVVKTQQFLAGLFGGFTSLSAKGGYMSDMEGLISEPVVVVSAWASAEDYSEKLDELETFLMHKRDEWEQEVIGFEFDNDFFMFPEYQESKADFFLTEAIIETAKTDHDESFFQDAEENIKKYISQMLGMNKPTSFVNDEGEVIVVNQGYGSEQDHLILEEYEKWLFDNCESFAVQRGEYFTCTMRYEAQMKECYYNSLMYSWEDKDAQYYEGWVVSESLPLPIRHAWIVKDGQVFDPTFDVLRRDMSRKSDERIYYYGAHIPADFIVVFMNYSSYAGPYLFDYFFYDNYGKEAYGEYAQNEPQGSLSSFGFMQLRNMANPFMSEKEAER